MRKHPLDTLHAKDARRTARVLAALTPTSEFFGLVGRGYTNSFYKVWVRPSPKSPWYLFHHGEERRAVRGPDPVLAQIKLPVSSRVVTVGGPIARLAEWKHAPGGALDLLFACAAEMYIDESHSR